MFRFQEIGSDDRHYHIYDRSRDLTIAIPKRNEMGYLKFPSTAPYRPWKKITWGLDFKGGKPTASGLALTTLSERHQIYAPPSFWGNWEVVSAHCGAARYRIEVEAIGDTHVVGQVKYYSDVRRDWVIEDFFKSTTIITGNAYSTVSVRLKGAGLGSSCWVTAAVSSP